MSLTGLDDGDFTSINVMYGIGLGNTADTGTNGQVIKSDGTNAVWGTDDTDDLTAGAGISIITDVIATDNDDITINNSGVSNTNQVLKVPNALTAGTNITFSAGTTFDGSSAITINSDDPTLPNSLRPSAEGVSSGSRTLAILNNNTGAELTSWDGSVPARVKLNLISGATTTIHTSATTGTYYEVDKVPNALTAGSGIEGSSFDGAVSRTWDIVSPYTKVSSGVYKIPISIGGAYRADASAGRIDNSGGNLDGWLFWDTGAMSFTTNVPSGYTITSYYISLYDGTSSTMDSTTYFAIRDRIQPTTWAGHTETTTGTNVEVSVGSITPSGITDGSTQYCVLELPHNESPSGGNHYSGGGWIKITKT